ncbi:hypothetical protein Goarm_013801 [Gossypium armourianum]|uniref:Uncharacterized protein n=1 Tax=Gossypium armourianum TaxID=34283 RepID=A0A7J9J464_9ROSI|nr:hypothetical protein [Gossypium armourianum]
MSALVDIWSDEFAKLREKGQTLFSTGSTHTTAESGQVVRSLKKGSTESAGAFVSRVTRVKSPVVLCSEGSISVLVECFSP